jgi:hypothetical protein
VEWFSLYINFSALSWIFSIFLVLVQNKNIETHTSLGTRHITNT